jgi:hypothetical protein
VGPRAVLDTVSNRKIPSPRRESKPYHPIVHPVASRYTDWAIPAVVACFVLYLKTFYQLYTFLSIERDYSVCARKPDGF